MSANSFKREKRILKRSDFVRLTKTGKSIENRFFIAAIASNSYEKTRLGITITKKTGCAAKRNKIKRWIREYFRQSRHNFRESLDINIIAKKKAVGISSVEAYSSLQAIFESVARKCDH